MAQTTREQTDEEIARLEVQRKWVREHYEHNPEAAYATVSAKLAVVNTVLESGWVGSNETVKLQCLGVAFGDALAQELGLRWVTVEDEDGTDPALIYDGQSIVVFPLTSISKRIERGETVDVYNLFGKACKTILGAKNEQG